jgi:hypothetical protein
VTDRRFYVYAIYVDEVVRYIGKGSNGGMYFHVIEAQRINGRRARGAKTDQTSTKFYRKLAEAMRRGAAIREVALRTRQHIALRSRRLKSCISGIDVSCGIRLTRECSEQRGKSTNEDRNFCLIDPVEKCGSRNALYKPLSDSSGLRVSAGVVRPETGLVGCGSVASRAAPP